MDLKRSLQDPDLLREAAVIAGRWIACEENFIEVQDPATGRTIGSVPLLGEAETVDAIRAADAAFRLWKKNTARQRSRIIRNWADLMITHEEDLARIMTAEQGKPLAEARGEIRYAASFVEWFAEECQRLNGEIIPSPAPDKRILVMREPIGVVAAITPWNFPSAMITRKVVPAIAAGCSVVLKPAEQTPFSALALAVLAERAGLPPGVFNIVTGDAPVVGAALCDHPLVRMLTFTGSTEVGRILMAQCAPTVKKLSLELGGNAPFIIFDDADLAAAVEGAMASKFRNAGQTCVCANRFLVQEGIHDRFVEAFAAASRALVVAPGFTPGAQQGPLIDDAAAAKLDRLLTDAKEEGARIHCGGGRIEAGSRFFQPTVLSVEPSMRIVQEELFGPVAPVIRFADEEDAIRIANDTSYGLAAYFYGKDLTRVWRVIEALEFGIVGVNSGAVSVEVAPFGGVKQSGLGREGGKHGIEEFTELKYVCLGGLSA